MKKTWRQKSHDTAPFCCVLVSSSTITIWINQGILPFCNMTRGHCMIPQFGLACPLYRRGYPSLLPCLTVLFGTNNPSLLSCPALSFRDRPSQFPVLSGLGQSMYPCPVQRCLYGIIVSCPVCPVRIESIHPDLLSCSACPIRRNPSQSLKSLACPRRSLGVATYSRSIIFLPA